MVSTFMKILSNDSQNDIILRNNVYQIITGESSISPEGKLVNFNFGVEETTNQELALVA